MIKSKSQGSYNFWIKTWTQNWDNLQIYIASTQVNVYLFQNYKINESIIFLNNTTQTIKRKCKTEQMTSNR